MILLINEKKKKLHCLNSNKRRKRSIDSYPKLTIFINDVVKKSSWFLMSAVPHLLYVVGVPQLVLMSTISEKKGIILSSRSSFTLIQSSKMTFSIFSKISSSWARDINRPSFNIFSRLSSPPLNASCPCVKFSHVKNNIILYSCLFVAKHDVW